MENNPQGVKFSDLCKVCEHYFGKPRQTGGSHQVYRTPWQGEPYVNIQSKKGGESPIRLSRCWLPFGKWEKCDGCEVLHVQSILV